MFECTPMQYSGRKESNGGGVHLHARGVCLQLAMAGTSPDLKTEQVKKCCTSFISLCRPETNCRRRLLTIILLPTLVDLEMIQVKFHKYLVRYHGRKKQTQQALVIPRQRFSSYVATEIFESARHHATYRFIIQDRLQSHDMLLVKLIMFTTRLCVFISHTPRSCR